MSKRDSQVEVQEYEDLERVKLSKDKLNKARAVHIGTINEVDIYLMDDEYIRNHIDIDCCIGVNYAHDAYVPEGEVWISRLMNYPDVAATIVHEIVECHLMVEKKMTYEDAHDRANVYESKFREGIVSGNIEVAGPNSAVAEAESVVDEFLMGDSDA